MECYDYDCMNKESLLLYAITDPGCIGERDFFCEVENALKGGVTVLQLREKNLTTDELIVRVAASETFREALHHGMRVELEVDSTLLIVSFSFDNLKVTRSVSEYYSDVAVENTLHGAYEVLKYASIHALSEAQKGTVYD